MLTQKGKFSVGVEYKGEYHKDFEIRPLRVKDLLEIEKEVPSGDLAQTIPIFQRSMIKLGTIPEEDITAELLEELYEFDITKLANARNALTMKADKGAIKKK